MPGVNLDEVLERIGYNGELISDTNDSKGLTSRIIGALEHGEFLDFYVKLKPPELKDPRIDPRKFSSSYSFRLYLQNFEKGRINDYCRGVMDLCDNLDITIGKVYDIKTTYLLALNKQQAYGLMESELVDWVLCRFRCEMYKNL